MLRLFCCSILLMSFNGVGNLIPCRFSSCSYCRYLFTICGWSWRPTGCRNARIDHTAHFSSWFLMFKTERVVSISFGSRIYELPCNGAYLAACISMQLMTSSVQPEPCAWNSWARSNICRISSGRWSAMSFSLANTTLFDRKTCWCCKICPSWRRV